MNESLHEYVRGSHHYLLKCFYVFDYKKQYALSERDLASELELSKSEIHRMLIVARTPMTLWQSVKDFKVDFYTLYFFNSPANVEYRSQMYDLIKAGKLRTHKQTKQFLKERALVRLQED
jgi:uncharacterized protein YtpQ (UPF0354 family)